MAGQDRGAVGNGFIEGNETVVFRDLVAAELKARGYAVITDNNNMVTGAMARHFDKELNNYPNGCIVVDFHFNAAGANVSGTECVVRETPTTLERNLALRISEATAKVLGINNRPLKTEKQSHRGQLYLFQTIKADEAVTVLQEVCFISNPGDMQVYTQKKKELAKAVTACLIEYAC